MNVSIDNAHQDFIRACVASGKFTDEVQVVNAALALFEERERLLADIDAGLDDFEKGNYVSYQLGEREKFIADIEAESRRLHDESSNA